MEKPRHESWFMENSLIPDFHYVLVDENFHEKAKKYSIWLRPLWRFFRSNNFFEGFLDGLPGLIIASSSSYECMLKYVNYHRELVISSHH